MVFVITLVLVLRHSTENRVKRSKHARVAHAQMLILSSRDFRNLSRLYFRFQPVNFSHVFSDDRNDMGHFPAFSVVRKRSSRRYGENSFFL